MENSSETGTRRITSWRAEAGCRNVGSDIFFPIGETEIAQEQIESALAICSACIVQLECLEYALETNQGYGIWGGYPEEERRRLRKSWLAEKRRRNSQKD